MLLGPPCVHSQQHLGPILRLGTARAGMHFDIGVVGIGLAREQAFQFHLAGPFAQALKRADGVLDHRLVVFGLGQLRQFDVLREAALKLTDAGDAALEAVAFAHQ